MLYNNWQNIISPSFGCAVISFVKPFLRSAMYKLQKALGGEGYATHNKRNAAIYLIKTERTISWYRNTIGVLHNTASTSLAVVYEKLFAYLVQRQGTF